LNEGGGDYFMMWSDSNTTSSDTLTSATSGIFRLVRHGTLLFFLFNTGSGWQALGKMTVPGGPASIYLGNMSVEASTAFTTYFDNFHINNGITIP
jgi:hypothetical protein